MASNISFSKTDKIALAMAVGDGLSIGDTNAKGDFVGGGVIKGDSKKDVDCGKGSKSIIGVGNTGEIVSNGMGVWVDVGLIKLIVSDIVLVDVSTVD